MKVDRVKGHLDLLLLSILNRSPGHGYAVITAVRELSDGTLELTEGAVYPALHRLEDAGLLAGVWDPTSGRRRRVYRLTEDGARALEDERRGWRTLVSSIEAVLHVPNDLVAGGAV